MNLAQRLRETLAVIDNPAPVTDAERALHAALVAKAREREHHEQQAALPLATDCNGTVQ